MTAMGLQGSCKVITASRREPPARSLCLVAALGAGDGSTGHPPASMEAVAERLTDLRRIVSRWTSHMGLQPSEREDIVSDAMLHLLSRAKREGGFGGKPLAGVLLENVKWAVARHCEATMRRTAQEELTPPEEIPEIAVEPPTCAAEQLGTIAVLTQRLSRQERELLLERYVLGLDSSEVAARHHMRPEAVTMCCSRARAKALKNVSERMRREVDVAFSEFAGIFTVRDQKAPRTTRRRRKSSPSGAPARRGAGRDDGSGPEKRLSREGRKEGKR